VAGRITTIIASGTNTTNVTPASYELDMYAKDAKVDNTCAATADGEKNTLINDPANESQIAIGLDEGFGPFTVPVKVNFNAGHILLCGYSKWSFDTATSAELRITTTAAGQTPASGPPAAYKRAAARVT
jgi:hypothetical protein